MKFLKKYGKLLVMSLIVTSLMVGCSAEAGEGKSESATNTNLSTEQSIDDYVIKLGYYNCDHMTAACIGKDAGIFEELGLNVEVTGNGKVPTAMAAGQMDAGYIGFTGLNRAYSKGSPIIVGANNHDGGSYYLVVSNDIKEASDLIGKPLGIGATPEKDNSCWVEMAKELNIPVEGSNYQGLNFDSDQAAYLAMKTGSIHGYMSCDPWGSMAEYEGTGRILSAYLMPEGEWGNCCSFALNRKFAEEHPELATKLVLAHTKSIEYVYKNPIKASEIFAENYKVPKEVALMTIYKKTVGEGRTLTWAIEDEKYKHQMNYEIEQGFYTEETNKYEDVVIKTYLENSGAKDFDEFIAEEIEAVFPLGMTFDEWLEKANELNS